MELFLNLCWLALLCPAYLLWRRRVSSDSRAHTSLVIIGTLGCVLILLFPVISASDDLQSAGQAIEESERSVRQNAHRAATGHSLTHASSFLVAFASHRVILARAGSVVSPIHPDLKASLAHPLAGRAPPYLSIS